MIEQLQRTKSIEQVKDASGPIEQYVWRATEGGVRYWIGSRKAIPVSIVRTAHILQPVSLQQIDGGENDTN